jgi:DNA-binding MarR family transcriptional regulator
MSKNSRYEKIHFLEVSKIEIHRLADELPLMDAIQFEALKEDIKNNGQKVPIIMYKGKVVDGRHRTKALKELGEKTIKAKYLPATMTEDDVKVEVFSQEKRRHQNPTQLAILAYKEYIKRKATGERVSMGRIAQEFGSNRTQVDKVKQIEEMGFKEIINELFNGNKINIGTQQQAIKTNSLNSILSFCKKKKEELNDIVIIKDDVAEHITNDMTEEEIAEIVNEFNKLSAKYSETQLKYLSNIIYSRIN